MVVRFDKVPPKYALCWTIQVSDLRRPCGSGLPPCGRRCREVSLLFLRPLPPTQASLAGFWAQNPKLVLGAFWVSRVEADSNRCSSFCRAEPSHSAIGPFPKWWTTVGLRIYESGLLLVSLLGDKFRKDGCKARGGGVRMG